MYWIKRGPLNAPLVTTGPASGDGNLADPHTTVLFGNSGFDYGRFNGMQYDVGTWLGEQHVWGVAASGFLLEQRAVTAHFASDGNGEPLLALPFNNISTIVNNLPSGTAAGYVVASPGAFAGSVDIATTTRLWGAQVNAVRNLVADNGCTFDLVAGFRYLDLEEQLSIANRTTQLAGGALFFGSPTPLPTGSVVSIADHFQTRNQFYGGEAGAQAEFQGGAFTVQLAGDVALGPNHQRVTISGKTSAQTPGGPVRSVPTGLFAVDGTNISRPVTNWFAISPEASVRVGYHVTPGVFAFVGYNVLYLNNVVRPGSQLNPDINPAFLPVSINFGAKPTFPPTQQALFQPALLTQRDEFWAQGLQFGVEFKY
jgi:hypothetical protein